MPVGPARGSAGFREGMASVPAPVYVVTAFSDDGPVGFTATAVSSLSADPPSLLFCVNQSNRNADAFRAGTPVAVHLLGSGQAELGTVFAGQRGAAGDKFAGVAWRELLGTPVLNEVATVFVGRITRLEDGFTHAIAVVTVDHVETKPDVAPLLYWKRCYQSLPASG